LALDAKEGERVCRFRESYERVLVLLCATFMHHVYFFALALYDMCSYEILL
jgi:hypothetical protein